jgi:hypothetical protein
MRDKARLTAELVKELGVTPESVYSTWWHNLRKNGGMRLTKLGYNAFCHRLDIERYHYELDPLQLNSRLMIKLDRQLKSPYFIEYVKGMATQIVFFGSKEAMLINLYRDLDKFIDNYH